MFLQEPNIDRNYVPGKIRNTWRISMLQYVLVCHPGPAQIRRETRFTFNGHRICIIVKWGTQLWIIWNDIDEKISIDFNVYEEKMHSQSFFKPTALLEMKWDFYISNYTKRPDLKFENLLGTIFILRKDLGVGGWFRKRQFSLTLCNENVLTLVGGWF